jgi:hypothetical protein
MIQDILKVFWVNLFLLPGEAGFMALVLYKEDILNLGSGLCTLGILFTANFFITCAFAAHIEEQKAQEKQQERIENS